MAITSMTQLRSLRVTEIRVVSDLSGTIYYHWYDHGRHIARTTVPALSVSPVVGEQMSIEVIDTTDADFDYIANAPDGYPPWRVVKWHASSASDVSSYLVEQNVDAGGWEQIAEVRHDPAVWQYVLLAGPLDDLTSVQFRIRPTDTAGNIGTAKTLDAETVVRTPDAPAFSATLDEGTGEVTIAAA